MTAGRAVLLPIAVYAWQVLGAGYTFRAVKGEDLHLGACVADLSRLHRAGRQRGRRAGESPSFFGLGCAGLIAALALFEWARRTVRCQFFSWIFSSDTPAFLCTSGPYAYVRNPFYTSYLLTMASTLVMVPSLFRLLVLGGLVIYFDVAARHEERKFAGSALAEEYARYRQRTGRFLPKFSAVRR